MSHAFQPGDPVRVIVPGEVERRGVVAEADAPDGHGDTLVRFDPATAGPPEGWHTTRHVHPLDAPPDTREFQPLPD